MRTCRKCHHTLKDEDRFCSTCGAPFIEETIVCPSCGAENDLDSPACSQCGFSFFAQKAEDPPEAHNIFDKEHMKSAEQEVADRFSRAFEKRLKEEHHQKLRGAYIDRFFKSEFRTSADYRIQQLAEVIQGFTGDKRQVEQQKEAFLSPAFGELIDYFIVRYCSDLNETLYPEAMLKYQGLNKDQVELGQMIKDYLDFENEDEAVWFDFVEMPASKLKNAADSFLFPKKDETLYFICNLSLLRNCKDGFAMTDKCIYWKMPFEKKQRVYYSKLKSVKREEDWITINGIFFNANRSLNLKLMRLLKKLGGI